jgi:uncharacterized membrane protein YciS (DUF1049 family)
VNKEWNSLASASVSPDSDDLSSAIFCAGKITECKNFQTNLFYMEVRYHQFRLTKTIKRDRDHKSFLIKGDETCK